MNIEKEIRIKINKNDIENIKNISEPVKKETHMIDITLGKYGFESLKKTGYICRIRYKNNEYYIEIKKYLNNDECIEKSIKISGLQEGIEFLNLLGYEMYLVLDRYREIRKYNNLILYIDKFEDIGNYLEIEYQNTTILEAYEFINDLNLDKELQDKYGDIVYKKLNNDEDFSQEYNKKLSLYKK